MTQQLVLPGDEIARKAGALRAISLGLLVAVILGEIIAIVIWLFERSFPIVQTTMADVGMILISVIAYWLARIGKSRLGGFLFVIGFLLVTAVITAMFGGVTGPIGIIYVFPILVSGIVISTNYGFLIATLASILYLVISTFFFIMIPFLNG